MYEYWCCSSSVVPLLSLLFIFMKLFYIIASYCFEAGGAGGYDERDVVVYDIVAATRGDGVHDESHGEGTPIVMNPVRRFWFFH